MLDSWYYECNTRCCDILQGCAPKFVLPRGIGQTLTVSDVPAEAVTELLAAKREEHRPVRSKDRTEFPVGEAMRMFRHRAVR